MTDEAPLPWAAVAERIADRLGLHFPVDRVRELRRGLQGAAAELGLADAAECAHRLLADRLDEAQVEVIASHLTIGETYFFRGDETFAALTRHVLPGLIEARRHSGRRLRLWSAGCCTGEEPYSLAILLRGLLPDIDDWDVRILATDINPTFLRKAREGVYGQWSFRGTPKHFRERWFERRSDGRYEIAPAIRAMVTFAPMNLVDADASVPQATGTQQMDLVLCRNVLMYFTVAQATRVVARLHGVLRSDGWLVAAPCEVSQALFPDFQPVGFEGAILYRRRMESATPTRAPAPPPASIASERPAAAPAPQKTAIVRGRFGGHGVPAQPPSALGDASLDRARALANQGKLAEALACCDAWIAEDKLDAGAHYLRAMVLMELGEMEGARVALQRSLYLAPDVAMTCFAAGNLERALGRPGAAALHYRHVLELVGRERPDTRLGHSEGITAAQLAALARNLLATDVRKAGAR